jgi:hypothetical protein
VKLIICAGNALVLEILYQYYAANYSAIILITGTTSVVRNRRRTNAVPSFYLAFYNLVIGMFPYNMRWVL